MDKELYSKLINDETVRHEDRIKEIQKDYANSNNTVLVGSIITDDLGTIIEVDRIGVYLSDPPCCFYWGQEYTKKMEPRKDERRAKVYQSRLV